MVESAISVQQITLSEHDHRDDVRLTEAQREALTARFASYLSVAPTWTAGLCQLRSRQYVGSIILDDLHIRITPKVPLDNLFYMLSYAYDLPEFRRELTTLAVSEDLFEFVASMFVKQVEQLVRGGIQRNYVDRDEDQQFLRGRLLLGSHLQRNLVKAQRFYQRHNEHTVDLLENQILCYTLARLARLDFRTAELTHRIRRLGSAFHEVSLRPIRPVDCDRVAYTRLNNRYYSQIQLAKLILQNLSVEGHSGATQFAAYMLDMNQVFELFVARYLAHYFADHPQIDVAIQDDIWLDESHKEKGIPDIVLYYDRQPALVLDTKYKTFDDRPTEADRNQMLVYSQRLAVRESLLIYAAPGAIDYVRNFSGTTLLARDLKLDGDLAQFRARCELFARNLVTLIADA